MSYETPPTVSPDVTTAVNALITAIGTNYTTLTDKLLTGCYTTSGLNAASSVIQGAQQNSSTLSLAGNAQQALADTAVVPQTIMASFIENQIVPMTQRHDSGWVNHPKDPRGAMMKGVTLKLFRDQFDAILVATNIPEIKTAVTNVDKVLPKWKSDDTQGQQYLYQLLTDQKAMALWIWFVLSGNVSRYSAAVAAIDPYLGYLLFEFSWTSGPIIYETAGINSLAKTYGWNGNDSTWISFMVGLKDKSPQFTMDLLAKRAAFINTLIKNFPEFQEGWMGRFINNPGSNLDYVVVVNENFNYNKKSLYTFPDNLKAYLEKKGKIYETLKITV
jgi:hypothetical protein